jgi:hypothetical protein
LNPRPHEAQLQSKKPRKIKEDHLEEEKTVRPTKDTKSGKQRKRAKKISKLKNSKLPLTLSMQSLPIRLTLSYFFS